MEYPIYVSLIVILILASSFFSASETAFSSLNRIRLKNSVTNGDKKMRLVARLSDNYDSLISTVLIGNNIVNITAATLSTRLFSMIFMDNLALGASVSTIVITIAVLIFGEITPKTLAKKSPEFFAKMSAPILYFVYILLWPLTKIFGFWQFLVGKIFKPKDKTNITDQELITYIDEAEHEGGLDEYEGELIRSAIEFDDLTVGDIYTPRVDVKAIKVGTSLAEIINIFRQTGFSRLPVYKDSIDNIVGIINEKDCYKAYMDKSKSMAKIISKNVIYANEHMKISLLLRKLQMAKTHMAIVVDEFGGTMGIVTMEDILEELVGDIWDEHDEIIENFKKVTDDKYIVLGETYLEDFFEFFNANKNDEEFEPLTLNGFVTMKMGTIPNVGDSLVFENLTITVKQMETNFVNKVEVAIGGNKDNNTEQE